jgi:filamentous hemagglutinin
LFEGKYVSLRDAGNILAGINARTHGESFDDYMKGAGAYQVRGRTGAILSQFGAKFGPPPYYGEQEYTGSRVQFGYNLRQRTP